VNNFALGPSAPSGATPPEKGVAGSAPVAMTSTGGAVTGAGQPRRLDPQLRGRDAESHIEGWAHAWNADTGPL
jgi:hypothetical protein